MHRDIISDGPLIDISVDAPQCNRVQHKLHSYVKYATKNNEQ